MNPATAVFALAGVRVQRCHVKCGNTNVRLREELCEPHVGSAQRRSMISEKLWLLAK